MRFLIDMITGMAVGGLFFLSWRAWNQAISDNSPIEWLLAWWGNHLGDGWLSAFLFGFSFAIVSFAIPAAAISYVGLTLSHAFFPAL